MKSTALTATCRVMLLNEMVQVTAGYSSFGLRHHRLELVNAAICHQREKQMAVADYVTDRNVGPSAPRSDRCSEPAGHWARVRARGPNWICAPLDFLILPLPGCSRCAQLTVRLQRTRSRILRGHPPWRSPYRLSDRDVWVQDEEGRQSDASRKAWLDADVEWHTQASCSPVLYRESERRCPEPVSVATGSSLSDAK